ncbi:MAG: hypothetical protein ACLFVW_06740, partial [Phycisphaerae bacterium]
LEAQPFQWLGFLSQSLLLAVFVPETGNRTKFTDYWLPVTGDRRITVVNPVTGYWLLIAAVVTLLGK